MSHSSHPPVVADAASSTISVQPSSRAASVSRRRVVAAGAWTVPVVAASLSAPLAAASTTKEVDAAVEFVGLQASFTDRNVGRAPRCLKVRSDSGTVEAGSTIAVSYDPEFVTVELTGDNATATSSAGLLTVTMLDPVAAGDNQNIHIAVYRAGRRGGRVSATAGDTEALGDLASAGADLSDVSTPTDELSAASGEVSAATWGWGCVQKTLTAVITPKGATDIDPSDNTDTCTVLVR